MKVSTKLSIAFALHAALLVGLLIYHVRTIRDSVATGYELSEISSRLYTNSNEQLVRIARLEDSAAKYSVTRDPGYLEMFDSSAAEFFDGLRSIASLPLTSGESEAVAHLAHVWGEFRPLGARLESIVEQTADPFAAQESLATLSEHLHELRLGAMGLSAASRGAMVDRLDRSTETARASERMAWVATTIALLMSALVSVAIIRFISRRLGRLQQGTHEVAEGDFSCRLEADGRDEFAEVARDFNIMTSRLGELEQMKRDFVSKVSHDLKTPLASMQETVDVLLDGVVGELTERQERLLRLNHHSGVRLSEMIAKLLDLSSLDAGGLRPNLGTYEIAPIVNRAVSHVAAARAERGGALNIETPDDPIVVECDAERIIQVLDNLIENALRFSQENAAIRVSVRFLSRRPSDLPKERWDAVENANSVAGALLIEVGDHGPGVPDQLKERIFERFVQINHKGMNRRGVGLGLTICRDIVQAHRGSIWVCDAPGGGSLFRVLLPGALRVPTEWALAATGSEYEKDETT